MRSFAAVLLYALLVLALQIAGAVAPTPVNWGVHHYGFLPSIWLWAGAVGALVLAGLGWSLAGQISRGPGSRALAALLGAGIVLVGMVLFWVGRERSTFLGDGTLLLESMRQGRVAWSGSGALVVLDGLNRLLGSPDPAVTLAAVSVVCGALYLLLAWMIARGAANDGAGRTLLFGLLATAGLTRLFYGYVEVYPLLACATLLYLALALAAQAGRAPFWPVALVGALLPLLHVTGLLLWPSLLYLVFAGRRAEASAAPAAAAQSGAGGSRLLLLLLPACALLAGMFLRGGPGAMADLAAGYMRGLLPISGPLGTADPYTLFSAAHGSDLLQEQWLVGPFGALLAILLLILRAHGGMGSRERFLLWAGGPWWIISLLFNRGIGAPRDWDLFAAASIPWILLLGLLLVHAPWWISGPRRAAAVALILGASFFHLLPWVAVDTDAERSLGHVAALYGPGSRASGFARSYAFEEIGTWYLDRGQSESAVEAFREAAALDTTNARVTANLGAVLLAQGKPAEAASVLELAVRRDARREFAQYQLGNAYQEMGRIEEAGSAYRKALALNPEFLQATLNYAALERRQGNLPLAEALLRDGLRHAPQNADLLAHLARVQEDKGDTAAAAVGYREAVQRNPDDTASAFNLGYLLMRQGNITEASRYFEMVVARVPGDAEAWINLGVARDLEGDAEAARIAFEQAIAADPRRPEGYLNLARGYLAAQDTTQAARVLRSFTALDSTSAMGLLARRLLEGMEGRGRP